MIYMSIFMFMFICLVDFWMYIHRLVQLEHHMNSNSPNYSKTRLCTFTYTFKMLILCLDRQKSSRPYASKYCSSMHFASVAHTTEWFVTVAELTILRTCAIGFPATCFLWIKLPVVTIRWRTQRCLEGHVPWIPFVFFFWVELYHLMIQSRSLDSLHPESLWYLKRPGNTNIKPELVQV